MFLQKYVRNQISKKCVFYLTQKVFLDTDINTASIFLTKTKLLSHSLINVTRFSFLFISQKSFGTLIELNLAE